MKVYYIAIIKILLCIGSVFASGVLEYEGQNYFAGMGTSGWAIGYALGGGSQEEFEGWEWINVIKDNKFYFIESLTGNLDIEGKLERNGYLKYGDEIETINYIPDISFYIVEDENGAARIKFVDFEIIYNGETIYYNKDDDIDFSITIVGYATNRKIIITEIFLTEEAIEEKWDKFKLVE